MDIGSVDIVAGQLLTSFGLLIKSYVRVGNPYPNPEAAKCLANFGIRILNPFFNSGFGFLIGRIKLAS